MITVACWLWRTPGYRSQFTGEHVNVLRAMVARHYQAPHRFLCVTNDAAGIAGGVEIVSDRADFAGTKSPHGAGNPACYRRLRLFAPDAAATFGERVVSLDLDCVITGDLRPLWDRDDSFVGWRDAFYPRQINGSMMLLRTGSHPDVWAEFDPETSPREALARDYKGSDQGWISYRLPGAAHWSRSDGVYSYRVDGLAAGLPANARIVFFHGRPDPWDALHVPWIKEHWR